MVAITTLPEVVFSAKREQLVLALVGAFAFFCLGVAMLCSGRLLGIMYGGLTAVLTFLVSLRGTWRLVHWNQPKLTINSTSITDTRLSPVSVPWSIVSSVDGFYVNTGISRGPIRGARLMVPDDFMADYMRSTFYRRANVLDRALGFRGISIPAIGMGISGDELVKICSDYWNAARKEGSAHV